MLLPLMQSADMLSEETMPGVDETPSLPPVPWPVQPLSPELRLLLEIRFLWLMRDSVSPSEVVTLTASSHASVI